LEAVDEFWPLTATIANSIIMVDGRKAGMIVEAESNC
jgi:hypothetical protein